MIPRKHARFPMHFPITFTGDHEGEGLVTNLSIGGCCVDHSNIAVDVKAMLTVSLCLSDDHPPVKIDAALVRWSPLPTFGLEFIFIAREDHARLEQYLAAQCAQPTSGS